MLHIYCGREDTDKEKFMFGQIKGKTLLLVPDQFSLQAERDAFFYMGKKGLMDLRVMDFSMLGNKAVHETCGKKPALIDQYGRHMLLTKVMRKIAKDLTVYRDLNWKNSFIDLLNSLISDMKLYQVSPERLAEVLEGISESGYLKYKLSDIQTIYAEYQRLIEGKYLDSDDYIDFYSEKLTQASMVAQSEIWIYGYDTFTPKNLLIIGNLLRTARAVNIVLTYEAENEIFRLAGYVIERLKMLAEDFHEQAQVHVIEGEKRKTVWENPKAVTLAQTSHVYAEAERAAAYIMGLVKEHGYRFGDIVLVCNDMEHRGRIFRRTFHRWGIPVFVDKKRKVLHHPAVGFLIAVMQLVSGGYQHENVMQMLKTGILRISADEIEMLENYVTAFKIRGVSWKSPFTKTGDSYSEADLERLNRLRQVVVETIEGARECMGRRNTAGEKTEGLYRFLDGDFGMRQRIEDLIMRQETAGLAEGAAQTAQSWNIICNIFDQIVEITGDERISNEELLKLMIAGFEKVEIGLVPVTSDCVIMGTMQRTRLSRVKVLLVVGANAGILPLENSNEGLLSEREQDMLADLKLEISKRDSVLRQEEAMAIYRAFHLPQERLYVSCSNVDEGGETLRKSEIFMKLEQYLAGKGLLRVVSDLETDGDVLDMMLCGEGALFHMAEAFHRYCDGGTLHDGWKQVLLRYQRKQPAMLEKLKAGMLFDNTVEKLGNSFAEALYQDADGDIVVSASRLEKYSSCPFAYFVQHGLRAKEPDLYEMSGREIGDIYHRTMMLLSQRLMPEDQTVMVTDPASPWMRITEDDCRDMVEGIIRNEMSDYKEGLTGAGKTEVYRTERLISICSDAAWAMVKQVKKGVIRNIYFERPFGKGQALPSVRIQAGGREVLIRGNIDRLDVLAAQEPSGADGVDGADGASSGNPLGASAADGAVYLDAPAAHSTGGLDAMDAPYGNACAIRIVDYKTGLNKINIDHMKNGYQLQLMVYLKAAMGGKYDDNGLLVDAGSAGEGHSAVPAGVFYFKIEELDTNGDRTAKADGTDNLEERLEKNYRMQGIMLHEDSAIRAMDSDLGKTADSGKPFARESTVIPVKFVKERQQWEAATGGIWFTRAEMDALICEVDAQVKRICEEICDGSIEIKPKREKDSAEKKTACKYCSYKSICMFDLAFAGCSYELV